MQLSPLSSYVRTIRPELPAEAFAPATSRLLWLPFHLAVIATCSVMTAPMGAQLAHKLPVKKLKRVFASLLYLLASYMLWKGLQG